MSSLETVASDYSVEAVALWQIRAIEFAVGIIEGGFSNTRGDGNSVDCLAQNDWNCETIFSWKMFPISCIAI
ncbi:hypothetical protein CFP56_014875 [Quercus suber]|uniref:Uncharacterized protein n=1 Tax=Quercus suber TaxID=58331 RepID=A0AAW0KRK4_QUESU